MRFAPHAVAACRGNAKRARSFVAGEADEETKFDELGVIGLLQGQAFECGIELKQWLIGKRSGEVGQFDLSAAVTFASLFCFRTGPDSEQ